METDINPKLKIILEAAQLNNEEEIKALAEKHQLPVKEIKDGIKKIHEAGNKIFRETKFNVEDLLKLTADTLENEFNKARIVTHYATSGKQAEDLLINLLNKHLPKRFAATTGFAIDIENKVSRQSDILLYDALNSAHFPISTDGQLILIDHLIAVIEVKSNLTKSQLTDAATKIASVKSLKQDHDIKRKTRTDNCLGIVFVYESEIDLEAAAEHLHELNSARPRNEWIDTIVILGRGMVSYTLQLPDESKSNIFIVTKNFLPPPGYINLSIFSNPEYPLHLFLAKLMGELGVFVGHSILSNNIIVGAISASKIHRRYVFDADGNIIEFNNTTLEKKSMFDVFEYAQLIGRFTIYKWANGYIFHTMQSPHAYEFLEYLIKTLKMQRFTFIEGLSPNSIFAYTTILKGEIPTNDEITQLVKKVGLRVEFRS